MGTSHTELSRHRENMKTLLVCSVLVAVSSAQYLGYPYGLSAPLTYTPHVIKPVVKEIEVPVKHITYGIKETGCSNVFGFAVPCLAEGEARRKRSADEAEEVAAPAPVLAYTGLPLGYAGYPYAHYPYAGYPYAAPAVTVAEPKVTEVEVPQYVYKAVKEKINLAPLCHNGLGFPVPCA